MLCIPTKLCLAQGAKRHVEFMQFTCTEWCLAEEQKYMWSLYSSHVLNNVWQRSKTTHRVYTLCHGCV